MNSGGVPYGDMPNFLGRRDGIPLDDAAVEALLTGTEPPAEAALMLQPVADVLDAMRAGPASDELAGEAMALAEFRRTVGASRVRASAVGAPTAISAAGSPAARGHAGGRRGHRRRRPALGSRLAPRVAAVWAVAALSLGGLVTAAYAGVLPAPMQRLAHEVIGAPGGSLGGPQSAGAHRGRDRAPGGRSALYQACAAYADIEAHGTAVQREVAHHNLAKAAGGASHIPGYCKRLLRTSTTRFHQPNPGKRVGPGKAGGPGNPNPQGQQRGKHKGQSKTEPSAQQQGQSGRQHHPNGQGQSAPKDPAR